MIEFVGLQLSPALTALLLGFVGYLLWRKQQAGCYHPPGPLAFPVIGNLPQIVLSGSFQGFLDNCRKHFGNIFTIEFGGTKQVVVSGYENIHDLLVNNADYTSNRSTNALPEAFQSFALETPGLTWAPFPHWKMLRGFALNVLRNEGMGSQSLEMKIIKEAEEFCKFYIEPELGQNFDLSKSFTKATNNVISQMIFGGRSEYDDPRFGELIESQDRMIRSAMFASITRGIPFLKNLQTSGVKNQQDFTKLMNDEMEGRLEKHKAALDVDNPADFFDEFLIHRQKQHIDNSCFTDGNAAVMAGQLYFAGSETVSSILSWVLLYTCLHPDTQTRVLKEIDDVIGTERAPKYSDRNNMPYTSAVLMETLRLANILPVALPHTLEKEMVVDGQNIPAGTDLMLNMSSVLHDDEVFQNPKEFDPDRFLTGDVKLKTQRTMAFSAGRRKCLGESLARMEIFLFYVSLVQKYEIKLAEGRRYSIEPISTFVNAPQPYEIVFTKRI